MTKYLIIISILLTGCGLLPTKTETIFVDKYVPIPITPHPPEIDSPEFYAKELTEEQKQAIGELAKAFVISSTEAIIYILQLEAGYELWERLAVKSDVRIESLRNMGLNIDDSLMEDANNDTKSELRKLQFEFNDIKAENDDKILETLNGVER